MTSKTLIGALLATTLIASPLYASETHPLTGEELAADQTFTYRVLD